MKKKRVEEGSNETMVITFRDINGDLTVPSAVRYRIDCVDDGSQIRDWTELNPASQIYVNLDSIDNDSYMVNQAIEEHQVTIEAEYGGINKKTKKFNYEVANLRFLS